MLEESKLEILVVDDEPNIRATLKEFFTELGGFDVDTADDGLAGLEKVKSKKYDAAFLDLQMPRMTGLELLYHIKEIDNTLPVIIMTGFPSLDAAIDTMRHGASDFLTKPVRLAQLKLVLERVLRERQLLVENLRLQDQLRQKEAIEKLNAQLNQKVKEQALLYNVAETISAIQNSYALYEEMVSLACDLLSARKAVFLLYDRGNEVFFPLTSQGFSSDQEEIDEVMIPVGQGVVGRAASRGQPIIYNNPHTPLTLGCDKNGHKVEAASFMCVPMSIRDEIFGMMVVTNKDGLGFMEDDLFLLQFLVTKAALSVENIALYETVLDNLHSTLRSLVTAIEAKDAYTEQHSHRVTELSIRIAQNMNLSEEEISSIRFSGYLHDIGKIGVRDEILTKPGILTPQEFDIMKTHTVIGERIVRHLGLLPREKSIIRHHHESWDGSGYPDGLAREKIPLLARIITVADSFDAMTSNRPYRKALTQNTAINELRRMSFVQFDGQVVEVFLELIKNEPEFLKDVTQRLIA